MSGKNDELIKRLLATFKVEAQEHMTTMTSGLIEIESSESSEQRGRVLETVYRAAHSLKGAARAVNMTGIEQICQQMESVFALLKKERLTWSKDLLEKLHQAADTVGHLMIAPEGVDISEILEQLTLAAEGKLEQPTPLDVISPQSDEPPPKPTERSSNREEGRSNARPADALGVPERTKAAQGGRAGSVIDQISHTDTVRISTARLDEILYQAEEMISAKLAAIQRVTDISQIATLLTLWKKQWAKCQSEAFAARKFMQESNLRAQLGEAGSSFSKLLDFWEWNTTQVGLLEGKIKALAKSTQAEARMLGGMVDHLLEDMKRVLMLPFTTLLEIFPKLVRELSRDEGKDVRLVVEGASIEIDKRILEEIKDALIHLVRNCIDHGIETPEERHRNKKPVQGTVTIAISKQSASEVEILISDDGAGIELNKLKDAAVSRGILSEEQAGALDEQETLSLIFRSDISTSPIITEISGRGIGMAIVREKMEKLNGFISVESVIGTGTSFRLRIPVTLATFRGTLIRSAEQVFAIPTMNVLRVSRIDREEIKTVKNMATITMNSRSVSLVNLDRVLELSTVSEDHEESKFINVLVLGAAEKRIAVKVDEILVEQEVLVRSLGKQLSRVRNVSGATVLGSGKVVPILNVSDLIKSVERFSGSRETFAPPTRRAAQRKKSILVAEDSITSRMLLKNILESAGHDVAVAVDGAEAWATLKTRDFDLLVSDVDMPNMDGFELTSRIRQDKKLSEMPVVMVTSLESRDQRERGIDVGANAYIVKSSFDQSNLLEVIQRLV